MPKKATYDVIVIGSGSAGFSAVEGALTHGASVCVIESGRLGGECPNYACIPSKALLKTARLYREVKHAREYGIELGTVSFDFEKIMHYRKGVVKTITGGGEYGERFLRILKKLNVDIKHGEATFVDDHILEVNGENLYGKTIVIATGSVDFVPPIPGLKDVNFWGWRDALESKRLPKSLAIIGTGPVGCEIATFYNSFGTRVTLLGVEDVVLQREDQDISQLAEDALIQQGIDVRLEVKANQVVNARGGVYGIHIERGDQKETVAVEQIMVATGKRSNVEGLGLELAGVQLTKQGVLKTTKEQQTNLKHIFGAGDVNGGLRFTHTAHHEGYVAGYNAALVAKGKRTAKKKIDERVVPRVTFIDPEVASVGMTSKEALGAYGDVLVGRYEMSQLGRAVTDNVQSGFVKILAHPKTRKIIGGHIIGVSAGEMIHEIALAIYLHTTIDKLADMIHAFPTFSEGIKAASANSVFESSSMNT
jgi:pyruvate/2-oxoglutarate dehydrogenase complex dihydrolipoamide dehydrogenase (E3) component